MKTLLYSFIHDSLSVISVFLLSLAGIAVAQIDPFAPPPISTSSASSVSINSRVNSRLPSGMEFVTIPGGFFFMGSLSSEEGRDSDEVRYRATVQSFEIMTTEVTQGMWEEVMGENPAHDYGVGDDYPVYYVSWNDCQEFIEKLNEMDAFHTYRLPNEVEWEYACRAGTSSMFYWSDSGTESIAKRYCWYEMNADDDLWSYPHANQRGTQPVGSLNRNLWGLYDMSGNVWEITEQSLRGGCWYSPLEECRAANKHEMSSTEIQSYRIRNQYIGFRLVRESN